MAHFEEVTQEEIDRMMAGSVDPAELVTRLREQASKYTSNQEVPSKEVTTPVSKPTRQVAGSRYPWNVWMNGEYHVAERGVDYDSPTPKFQVLLYRKAGDNDMFVRTEKIREHGGDRIGFMYGTDKLELGKKWAKMALDALGVDYEEEPHK